MRVSYLTVGLACVSYLALGLAPTQASAQLFRRPPSQRPAGDAQPAPDPAQPVPTAPAPQAPGGSNPSIAVRPPAAGAAKFSTKFRASQSMLGRSDRAGSYAAAN